MRDELVNGRLSFPQTLALMEHVFVFARDIEPSLGPTAHGRGLTDEQITTSAGRDDRERDASDEAKMDDEHGADENEAEARFSRKGTR